MIHTFKIVKNIRKPITSSFILKSTALEKYSIEHITSEERRQAEINEANRMLNIHNCENMHKLPKKECCAPE